MEASATGMPVVNTMHCDIPGLILHGETGLLSKKGNVDGLVTHLKWLMEKTDKWPAMLEAGCRHIEQEFNVGVQSRRLAVIYNDTIKSQL